MRILQVVHGLPPRETAGTERHVATIVDGLRSRKHSVHVLSATRAPGRRQYAVLREPGVTRIVNNVPARPASQRERDRAIEAIAAQVEAEVRPDVVHVHHLQFLSSGLRFGAPVVYTLHDAWTWCAAGGLELERGRRPCPGPSPERCGPCGAAWMPVPGRAARGLARIAGMASPIVNPDWLHAVYQRLPGRLRAKARREVAPSASAADAAARDAALAAFARGALITAPSAHLARRAEARGLGPVRVVPHGLPSAPEPPPTRRDGPLLFLGTIAAHKGPDVVVRAWRRAFPGGAPALRLHGQVVDAAAAAGHPIGPVLDRAEVFAALRSARALVMGSVWPENAPLVILEARAAGCPVIAPHIGGIPELITPDRDGWLYPPGDVEALSALMRRVVAAPPGPSVPPPSLDDQLDQYLAAYADAVAAAGAR